MPSEQGIAGTGSQAEPGPGRTRAEADAPPHLHTISERSISVQPEPCPAEATPRQSHNAGVQANRAAVAANEAYRAGDLDQARQLTGQAAALDPSRAEL
jgi:hypothetical protein